MAKQERTERADPYQVKVLDKAIDVLEAFTSDKSDLNIRDIVEATGLNRSTAIRLVANLERRGLLQKDPAANRFRLGPLLFRLGSAVYSSLSVLEGAAGPLSALEQRSGATIVLIVREGDYSVTVDKRQGVGDGFAKVSMPGEVGEIRPLTYGPVGQVFLSRLPCEEAEAFLKRYPLEQHTPYSLLDPHRFLERLPHVREEGYALEVNEVVEGLMGIAAPVFDFSGNVAGVISLGFPATRETDKQFVDGAIRDLKQTAAEVSANLGHIVTPKDSAETEARETEAVER